MTEVAAIVVAAGLSSRMEGVQKTLLPFRGKPMVEWVCQQIIHAGLSQIVVVVNPTIEPLMPKITGVKQVINPNYGKGLTSSIQQGILACSDQTKGFMICLADMPLIDSTVYQQLVASFLTSLSSGAFTITVPFFENQKGNPVIFSSAYRSQILNHHDPDGCKIIIEENTVHVIKVNVQTDAILKDVDTPSDYQALT